MMKQKRFVDNILEFNDWLSNVSLKLFDNYTIRNPYQSKSQEKIKEI